MVQIAFRHMNIAPIRESSNMAVKSASFGRWTAQKRAAFYLSRWMSPAEGGRRNGDAALGILVARKAVRL